MHRDNLRREWRIGWRVVAGAQTAKDQTEGLPAFLFGMYIYAGDGWDGQVGMRFAFAASCLAVVLQIAASAAMP